MSTLVNGTPTASSAPEGAQEKPGFRTKTIATRITPEELREVEAAAEKSGKSLSIKEVEAVLGQPARMESFPIEMQTTKELPGVRYYYKQDGRTIELHFVDNKLIRRVDHFNETPTPEESEHRIMHRATPTPAAPTATPSQPN